MSLRYWVIAVVVLFSCKQQKKFSREGWRQRTDMYHEERTYMIDDLLQGHPLKGQPRHHVLYLLGEPELEDSARMYYEVDVDYGWDIDPVYTKTLILHLNAKAVVDSVEVDEWRKK
jgi:hypothetical protein